MSVSVYQKIQTAIPTTLKTRLFETTRIHDIANRLDNIVVAKTTDSLYQVFNMLIDHNIIFAPLYDEDSQEYVGFIELVDILNYVIDVLKYDVSQNEDWINDSKFHNTPCIKANPIGSLSPERKIRNKWHIVNENAPLYTAINLFTQPDVSKIAVIDSYGKLFSVLTKSSVIDYISQQSMDLGELGDKNIDFLELISKNLTTVERHEKLINAFQKIYKMNASGIGVIDEKCNIIGNINSEDLYLIGLSKDIFRKLYMKTCDFLDVKQKNKKLLLKVHKLSDLKELLETIRNNEGQRIYVLTRGNILYGMVSLTNIMTLFNALYAPMPQR